MLRAQTSVPRSRVIRPSAFACRWSRWWPSRRTRRNKCLPVGSDARHGQPLAAPVRARVPASRPRTCRAACRARRRTAIRHPAGRARTAACSDAGDWIDGQPVVRTALTVEARDGTLCALPAAGCLGRRLRRSAVAAIEDTAAALQQPVLIEGYPPPFDPRFSRSR